MRDRPPIEKIAPTLLNSVGIKLKRTPTGMKFIYKEHTIKELEQLGFSIKMLKVSGGECPLPVLQQHLDEQSSLEAYWSAKAESARYRLSVAQDNYKFWFEVKYNEQFNRLQAEGIPKPTEREVNASISNKYPKALKKKNEKLRKLEYKYRMLNNACYTSIVTKGKMLQSLRNVVQGSGIVKLPNLEVETIGSGDPDELTVTGR